ncbi:MAG: hypothetical protein DMF61_26105 [Blastocatellia bacterium AA13]|nr:MAG: hypothetical protein DMF61_26105 [Blastocatellia bacterium AA13]
MKIAVASLRKAKIEAVRAAAERLAAAKITGWINTDLITRAVSADVSDTPTSDREMMQGARVRVEKLKDLLAREGVKADFFVGLEGGLHVQQDRENSLVFLRGWVYASDLGAHGSFGCTPSIEVPPAISERVLRRGEDLSNVIDSFAGRFDVRSNEGTWGVLTRDMVTRGNSFEMAVLAALAPFYNSGALALRVKGQLDRQLDLSRICEFPKRV